jgi:hypothetical protein
METPENKTTPPTRIQTPQTQTPQTQTPKAHTKTKRDNLQTDHQLQQKGLPLLSPLRGAALLAAGILTLSASSLLPPHTERTHTSLEKLAEAAYPYTAPLSKILKNGQALLADLLPIPTELDAQMERIKDTPQNYTLRENKKWREHNPEAAAELDAGLFKTLLETHQTLEKNPEIARQNAERDLEERREEINNEVLGIDIYYFQEREKENYRAAQDLVLKSLPPNVTHLPHQIDRLTRATLALERATEIATQENPSPELKTELHTLSENIKTLFQRSQTPELLPLALLTQKSLEGSSKIPNQTPSLSKKKTAQNPSTELSPQL